jgi:diguanylate cyclase (GGDEF)-like protein
VWAEIEASAPDLEALFEAGLRQLESPGRLDQAVRALRVDARGDSPVALALRLGRTVTRAGGDDLGGLLDLATSIAAPLRGRRAIHGVLYGDSCYTGRTLDPARELVFGLLAAHAGRAMESAMAYEQVARAARTDSLTGLGNHGSLMSDMAGAAGATRGSCRPLALVMVDLDDFKLVNDSLGHLAGDALLAEASRRIGRVLRGSDRAYRYGGDEFAVLLEETDGQEALRIASRIVEEFSGRPFDLGVAGTARCTCSAGVASMPGDAADAAGLLAAADAALIDAKRGGKNRVRSYGASLL